jgi:hypothetical protein
MSEDSLFWTAIFFGAGIGYLIGSVTADWIWQKRFDDMVIEPEEWIEEVPERHYKKKRRYS